MAPRGSFPLIEENDGAGKRLRADNDQPVFEEPPADTPSPLSPFAAPARGPPSPPFAAATCTPETSPCKEQRGGRAGVRTWNSSCFLFLHLLLFPFRLILLLLLLCPHQHYLSLLTQQGLGPGRVLWSYPSEAPLPSSVFFIFHIIQPQTPSHLRHRCESTPLSGMLMLDSAGTLVEEILLPFHATQCVSRARAPYFLA